MDKKLYGVMLQMGHGGKGIPYAGFGEARKDGYANHGFKNLKGSPCLLAEVPELQDDPMLHEVVARLNDEKCGLATVGCAGWTETNEHGHRWWGYVEFVINTVEATQDAASYFPLFFHFDRMLHDQKFNEPVNYRWEIEGAHFFPTNSDGFTCSLFVYTTFFPSAEAAREAWQVALEPLLAIGQFPVKPGQPIFSTI